MDFFHDVDDGISSPTPPLQASSNYIALSVVGTDRLTESPYFRAKIAQEKLIKELSIPYTIVHSTQFFEFVKSIADACTVDGTVHLAPVLIQPIAAEEVASAVARIATSAARLTGPSRSPAPRLSASTNSCRRVWPRNE